MKKIRLLTLFLCLSACNSPRLYTHFPAAYWTADNQLKSVTQTPALHEQAPQWSPDGLSLAYTVSGNKNEAGVFVSKPDGSNQVKVSQTIALVDKAEPPVN